MFQRALAAGEADEGVGRSVMPFRQERSAAGVTLQLVALGFPRGQVLGRFSSAGREQARPESAKIFFQQHSVRSPAPLQYLETSAHSW